MFRPVQISFDQFNTDYPITWLNREFRKRRIETRVFKKVPTAQTNWDRAEVFRTALYRNFIHAPHTSYDADIKRASDELKYLQEIKTGRIPRVEKQDTGPVQTKDIADCMMEVVEATIGDLMATQVRQDLGTQPVRFGAPGGYPIGGQDRGGYGRPAARPIPGGDSRMSGYYERTQRNLNRARNARPFPGRRGRLRGI
jgi:hypothetical protein